MKRNLRNGIASLIFHPGVTCALALAIVLGATPMMAMQGDETDAPPPPAQQTRRDDAPPPAPQTRTEVATPPAQQTRDEPTEANREDGPSPAYQPLPSSLTVPAGTMISVRTSQFLSSDQSNAGDGFTAELQQPIVVDGWVVARRGQTVLGRVAVAQKAGRVKGTSQLGVELSNLTLVDGQQLPIHTQLEQNSGGKSVGRDAQAVGTTTGVGAIIGAAAGDGKGAGIGAGAGAVAGIAGVLLTRGRPTIIPPETALTFQLQSPLTFSTDRSRPAFRPVTPQDYNNGDNGLRRRPQRFATAYPYYPPSYYGGYYPWGYYYPAPMFFGYSGFGGYYGFGGRFGRGGFRH